jgi:hypothetical protein
MICCLWIDFGKRWFTSLGRGFSQPMYSSHSQHCYIPIVYDCDIVQIWPWMGGYLGLVFVRTFGRG